MMEFTFEDSPWEQALQGLHRGDTMSAARFLALMEDEEEDQHRRRPSVGAFHQFAGYIAQIAERSAQHHTRKQRRKADMHRSDLKLQARDRNGQHNECNRNSHSFGA